MKKRKVNYPAPRTASRQPRGVGLSGDRPIVRSTIAEINLRALDGRGDVGVGDSVRIGGGGLYAGELAIVHSIVGGVIPAAIVHTAAGKTRRVRAVDLERVAGGPVAAAGLAISDGHISRGSIAESELRDLPGRPDSAGG